jgi:hypothetical protein
MENKEAVGKANWNWPLISCLLLIFIGYFYLAKWLWSPFLKPILLYILKFLKYPG